MGKRMFSNGTKTATRARTTISSITGNKPIDFSAGSANLLNTVGAKATYIYDLGDSWEHTLSVEKILPAELDVPYPLCIEGKLAAPPEDCGGIPGFYHMLEALADPNHEDHEHMRDCIHILAPDAVSTDAGK